jgi:hypothetical protein
MKRISQLIEELEGIRVFEYNHDNLYPYYTMGYPLDITELFINLHKGLKEIEAQIKKG